MFAKRSMPYGFALDANKTNAELMAIYGCSPAQIKRWRDEIGLHVGRGKSSRAVWQIDGNKVVKLHKSIRSAAMEVGGDSSNICLAAQGKLRKAYGYEWRYADELS